MKTLKIILVTSLLLFSPYTLAQQSVEEHNHSLPPVTKFGETYKRQKHGDTHYKNHNSYKEWMTPDTGVSCCNDYDCDITRIYHEYDEKNNKDIYYLYFSNQKLILPNDKRLREPNGSFKKSPDFNSHACILETELGLDIRCWVLGDTTF